MTMFITVIVIGAIIILLLIGVIGFDLQTRKQTQQLVLRFEAALQRGYSYNDEN